MSSNGCPVTGTERHSYVNYTENGRGLLRKNTSE